MEVRTAALTADWPYTRRGLSCRISIVSPWNPVIISLRFLPTPAYTYQSRT